MARAFSSASLVLTIRVTPETSRRLTRVARSSRRTRSETARAILESVLVGGSSAEDPAVEARRQSLLASDDASTLEVLEFTTTAADLRGWQ